MEAKKIQHRGLYLTGGSTIVIIIAMMAYNFWLNTQPQTETFPAPDLGTQVMSSVEQGDNVEQSLLLAVEAVRMQREAGLPLVEADEALRHILADGNVGVDEPVMVQHEGGIKTFAFSPDMSQLISTSEDGVHRLVDLNTILKLV